MGETRYSRPVNDLEVDRTVVAVRHAVPRAAVEAIAHDGNWWCLLAVGESFCLGLE